MRVFAPGFYMWENKGDAALVLSFVPWLREVLGAESITLTSFKPKSDAQHFDVPTLPMVTRPHTFLKRAAARATGSIPGARYALTLWRVLSIHVVLFTVDVWARLYLTQPGIARRIAPDHVVAIAEAIMASDAVVTVPGGYLLAARPTDDWWLYHLPTLRLAKRLGKQIVLGPCSVGPFAGVQEPIARRVLTWVDVLILREDRSVAIVESLGVPPSRIYRSPDMAFRFRGRNESGVVSEFIESLPLEKPLLGISVRSHHYPGHRSPARMEEEYLSSIVEAVERLCADHGAFAVVVPQTSMDASISSRLSGMLAARGIQHTLAPSTFGPDELQSIYARLRLMVGTRMHANILAMNVGTPVVGIAYEPKTLGILEDLGLGDWGIRIDEVSGGRLSGLVARQWEAAGALRSVAMERTSAARVRLDEIGTEISRQLQGRVLR